MAGSDKNQTKCKKIEFDIKKWKELKNNKGKLIFYEYPKKLKGSAADGL